MNYLYTPEKSQKIFGLKWMNIGQKWIKGTSRKYCFIQILASVMIDRSIMTKIRAFADLQRLSLIFFLWQRFVLLTLSGRRSLLHRNQSIDLQNKSMDWFLYDRDLCHERVNFSNVILNKITYSSNVLFPTAVNWKHALRHLRSLRRAQVGDV